MGVFYTQDTNGYTVTRAPEGAKVSYLPEGYATKQKDGKSYYVYDGTYYRAKMVEGGTAYVVTTV